MVHALGLGQFQVGRSHECDYPAAAQLLPVCTQSRVPQNVDSGNIDDLVKSRLMQALSFFDLNTHLIAELKPTHIITQTQCSICAVSREDVEQALSKELSSDVQIISLEAESLAGIWADINRIATSCGVRQNGQTLISQLQERVNRIAAEARLDNTRLTIACLEWLQPLMSAGNWIPELVEMTGAECLFGEAGKHSGYLDWQEVVAADPDIIVCLPCGFDIARTRQELAVLTAQPGWNDLKAVRSQRVYLCDGNQFMNRPGPRIVESLRIFAELAHPNLFESTLQGIGWEPLL